MAFENPFSKVATQENPFSAFRPEKVTPSENPFSAFKPKDMSLASKLEEIGKVSAGNLLTGTMGISESIYRTPGNIGRVANYLGSRVGLDVSDYNILDPDKGLITRGIKSGLFKFAGTSDIADQVKIASKLLPQLDSSFKISEDLSKHADEGVSELSNYVKNSGKSFLPSPNKLMNAVFNPTAWFSGVTDPGKELGIAITEGVKAGKGDKLIEVAKNPTAWAGAISSAVPSLALAYKSGGSLGFMGWLEASDKANDAVEFENMTGIKMSDAEFTTAVLQAGLINGKLEGIGLQSIMKKHKAGAAGLLKTAISGGATGAFGEGLTETLQQLNSNLATKMTYDKKQNLLEGVAMSFMGGFGSGGPAGAFHATIDHIDRGKVEAFKEAVNKYREGKEQDIKLEPATNERGEMLPATEKLSPKEAEWLKASGLDISEDVVTEAGEKAGVVVPGTNERGEMLPAEKKLTPLAEAYKTFASAETDRMATSIESRDPEMAGKRRKGDAMQRAAVIRHLEGAPTAKETDKAMMYLNSNYVGKIVQTPQGPATVMSFPAYGNVKVKLANGNEASIKYDKISSPKATKEQAVEYLRTKAEAEARGYLGRTPAGVEVLRRAEQKPGAVPGTNARGEMLPKKKTLADVEREVKVQKAIKVIKKQAADLGVNLGEVEIIDEEHLVDWNDPADQQDLIKAGYTKESYDAAIATGQRFRKTGLHQIADGGGRRARSQIKLFRGHTATDVFHEFAHAVEEQGGLPGWVGTKEQHAVYLESLLEKGEGGKLAEFRPESSRVTGEGIDGEQASINATWKTAPDGSVEVAGQKEEIRMALEASGVSAKGISYTGGLRFSSAVGQKVVRALKGEAGPKYSRAGEVTKHEKWEGGEKEGQIKGASENYNTTQKIQPLRALLRSLTEAAVSARYWYERSGKAVLALTGGNVPLAKKFMGLIAIYSPGTDVPSNMTAALKAWYQWLAGKPIVAGRFGDLDEKASRLLYEDKHWEGEKTNNFYINLMRFVDPAEYEKLQGVTVDMWMMRLFGYAKDSPTDQNYKFVETEVNRLAQELGWEPQQVQAALWTSIKIRSEDKGVRSLTEKQSLKAGDMVWGISKNGKKVREFPGGANGDAAKRHRNRWFRNAMALEITPEEIAKRKIDFADTVIKHESQMSYEAIPGRASGLLPGIHEASMAEKLEYSSEIIGVLIKEGKNLLTEKMGIPTRGAVEGPGFYMGDVNPGIQSILAIPPRHKPEGEGETQVSPEVKSTVSAYAGLLAAVLNQEAVAWFKPFYAANKRDSNGMFFSTGKPFLESDGIAVYNNLKVALDGIVPMDSVGLIPGQNGFYVNHYAEKIDNIQFQKAAKNAVLEALKASPVDIKVGTFKTDGDYITSDFKEDPNGTNHFRRAVDAGFGDAATYARDVLAPQVQAINEKYSGKYGRTKTVTSQASIRAFNQAAFFSVLEKTIQEKMPVTAPREQVLGILASSGVKKEEIDWLDIEGFLKDKTKVSKDEILDFIRSNNVKVEEVVKGDIKPTPENVRSILKEAKAIAEEQGENWEGLGPNGRQRFIDQANKTKDQTKFSQYQLPGGENYKELLLTIPVKGTDYKIDASNPNRIYIRRVSDNEITGTYDTMPAAQQGLSVLNVQDHGAFKSSHFEEPNVLAHVRFNERIDSEGKKVLFIEEVQSDWHQKGRKEGYAGKQRSIEEIKRLAAENTSKQAAILYVNRKRPLPQEILDQLQELTDEYNGLIKETEQINNSVPNAPFKKTWHELVMKRMLRYAAENGFDKIAWTTGEQQAERYDLSKQMSAVIVDRSENGTFTIKGVQNDNVGTYHNFGSGISSDKISDFVGKDLAEKIKSDLKTSGSKRYSGIDLKVGGEGMKGFYDQILPSFLNKYTKKWGGRVGTSKISSAEEIDEGEEGPYRFKTNLTVHSLELTPSMKESVIVEGQPLFSIRAFGPEVTAEEKAPPQPTKEPTKATRVFERVREDLMAEYDVEIDPESYEVTNLEADIKRAMKFVIADPDRAFRIAMGIEPAPDGILENNISHVVAQMMTEKTDLVDAARTFKAISFRQTARGKEIASEKSWINANSASHFVKLLLQSRMEKIGKISFDPRVPESKSRVKTAQKKIREKTLKVKEEVLAAEINMDELQSAIDDLVCK